MSTWPNGPSTGYRFRSGPEPAATDSDDQTTGPEVATGAPGPATAPPIVGTSFQQNE